MERIYTDFSDKKTPHLPNLHVIPFSNPRPGWLNLCPLDLFVANWLLAR
jgi:hypothetical protein